MLATLFVVIFISFIGIGLPDATLGTAWPSMYQDLNLPLSLAGYISATINVGTIIASLASAWLIKKFGTGLVSAISTLLTAVALLGFSFVGHSVFFFLLAIPLGLGAGAVDTALNNFVVLHYSASKMSYLHCFYGLGVAISPFIMSLALGENGDWRKGYFLVAILQFIITAICFLALPLWNKVQKADEEQGEAPTKVVSLKELLKKPSFCFSCLAFLFACSVELTAGGWCSTYFFTARKMPESTAALMTTVYYVGLTLARFLSGTFADKLGRRRILRISIILLLCALLLFMLPLWNWLAVLALFLVGLGIGPVYPNLVHLTPKFFGKECSQSVIGAQQATTYVGIMLMPWLYGILAEALTPHLLPFYLLIMFAIYALSFFALLKAVKKEKAQEK